MKQAWLAEWRPLLTSDETPLNPYRVIHDLMSVVDRTRTIITHDSGTPRDQLAPFWETLTPRGFLGWGKSTQLGSSLGFALGAKLAAPDKLVIHFLGDTALGMCGMDLETAARERIPILTVLVNNGLMGGYDRHIPLAGGSTAAATWAATTPRWPRAWRGRGAVVHPAEIVRRCSGPSPSSGPSANPKPAGPRWWSSSPARRRGCPNRGDRLGRVR